MSNDLHHYNFYQGEVLLFNKPLTWTSFQLVNKVKWLLKNHPSLLVDGTKIKPKVGHAGTLDPLATGLLIVCTGKKTKEIESYQAQEKEYTGTIYLGATTPCFDLEQEIDQRYPTEHITKELIYEAAERLSGKQFQTPPIFSAVKVNGKRAYDLARKGEVPEIKAKEIEIKEFHITRIALPEVDFKIVCSKGTYIRSLARDFGLLLNSGAHLTALCRTRIGEYRLDRSINVEDFAKEMAEFKN
ncbi:MAG: tRNA pseudouridine(55) synthase TruB [Bacteroidia bacterium]